MKKRILVTGSHRSGSTWTGKVICQSKDVRYVHEPFNVGTKKYNFPFRYWFEYMPATSNYHQSKVARYLNSFDSITSVNDIFRHKRINSLRRLYHALKDHQSKLFKRSLYKDPIAVMSAEWFYRTFNSDVIVLIRHPAAFVASLKVKGWFYNFNNFKNQPQLIDENFPTFKEQIIEFSKEKKDIIDQGILLWNTIHSMILKYQAKYDKEWIFIRHEDLSYEPTQEFHEIFNRLNLKFDDNVKDYILKVTQPKEHGGIGRDAKKNVKNWKNRLTEEEIIRIKEGTNDIWQEFYKDMDW